ncbi:hypothetical protein [Schleiferilactobacillus harbinensis]|nr:hypothetical protein [Schleiferilactobacillus harbinensis]MCI1849479.1 hypothetical protein [Schleiferilactobacillus harbinensis]QEU48203.1 hypothetical protein FMM01_13275 [Schleiferilactobacillus harbinensis]
MRTAAAIIGIFLLGLVVVIILGREVGVIHRVKPAGYRLLWWCAGLGVVFLLLGTSWQAMLATLGALACVSVLIVILHFSNR